MLRNTWFWHTQHHKIMGRTKSDKSFIPVRAALSAEEREYLLDVYWTGVLRLPSLFLQNALHYLTSILVNQSINI